MDNGLTTRWFLGANSGSGFYSLYDNFASEDGDFLWILKGGPGCGKSCFLKCIGNAAEKAGLATEYIYCSGDPASLDGLYIPAVRTGWIDGTAPHTLDPMYFGASGAYIDLGAFCDTDATRRQRGKITAILKHYRELYSRAYACLTAASAAAPEKFHGLVSGDETASAVKRASAVAERELPKIKKIVPPGRLTRRFLSGTTCDGRIFFEDTLTTLCKRIYTLDNRFGLAWPYISELAQQARTRGVDAVLCPLPLDPEKPEALIFPSLSLGFLATGRETQHTFEPYRHVRLDSLVSTDRIREVRSRLRSDAKIEADLLDAAAEALREAAALHGELEAIYNPFIDFDGVYETAESQIKRVIG